MLLTAPWDENLKYSSFPVYRLKGFLQKFELSSQQKQVRKDTYYFLIWCLIWFAIYNTKFKDKAQDFELKLSYLFSSSYFCEM